MDEKDGRVDATGDSPHLPKDEGKGWDGDGMGWDGCEWDGIR